LQRGLDLRIIFLGTAAGLPTVERGLPAVLVEVEGEYILFDCGEGTQRQMVKAGLSLGRRMKVFISHLHGDHIFGLPGMIQTMNLLNRVHPLDLYGPPGLCEFIQSTTISTMSEPSFQLTVNEVSQGSVFSGKNYRVEGAWVEHSRPNIAYRMTVGGSLGVFKPKMAMKLGIPQGPLWSQLKGGKSVKMEDGRVVEPKDVLGSPVPGKVIVYSGDTSPSESLARLARGADILIHEATLLDELAELAERDGHSTAGGVAKLAAEAGVGRLILTHISARYKDPGGLLAEAKRFFPRVEIARDLASYELKI
jgi:ribonuclease Z